MPRSWSVALVTCLVLATTACGSDASGDIDAAASPGAPTTNAPSASASPTGSTPPTEATLKQALLGVQDFPTGWKTSAAEDDDDDIEAGGDCGDRLEAFDDKYPDSKITVEASFERESDEIDQELKAYADATDLTSQFSEYAELIRGCTTLVLGGGEDEISLEVAELSLPKLGDESFAYSATGQVQGFTVALNFALVRRGLVFLQMSQAGVLSADAELLADITAKALAKLDQVVPASSSASG